MLVNTPYMDPMGNVIYSIYIYIHRNWLVVEPSQLKNMPIKLDHLPKQG